MQYKAIIPDLFVLAGQYEPGRYISKFVDLEVGIEKSENLPRVWVRSLHPRFEVRLEYEHLEVRHEFGEVIYTRSFENIESSLASRVCSDHAYRLTQVEIPPYSNWLTGILGHLALELRRGLRIPQTGELAPRLCDNH